MAVLEGVNDALLLGGTAISPTQSFGGTGSGPSQYLMSNVAVIRLYPPHLTDPSPVAAGRFSEEVFLAVRYATPMLIV